MRSGLRLWGRAGPWSPPRSEPEVSQQWSFSRDAALGGARGDMSVHAEHELAVVADHIDHGRAGALGITRRDRFHDPAVLVHRELQVADPADAQLGSELEVPSQHRAN